MSHLDILLPFALPPDELARDLLREIKAPALAALLSHAQSGANAPCDAFARALPHEKWLANRLGLAADDAGSPPFAQIAMRRRQLPNEAGLWFILTPVHIHATRDHLVLTDFRQLTVTEDESKTLFAAALPLVAEVGKELVYGDAKTWFLRSDEWTELQTSTPDAACGHNIDIWMPQGANARAWRKLQNEVQMQWHFDPLNQEREARGIRPVNSLWIWGGANAHPAVLQEPYQKMINVHGALDPVGAAGGNFSAAEALQSPARHTLLGLGNLTAAALAGDWRDWLQQIHELEQEWFIPILDALKTRRLQRVSLVLSHNTRLSEFVLTPRSFYKFWVKPTLGRLT